jgi:hypothetical protein
MDLTNSKVYNIALKKYEPFSFYILNDMFINITNKKKPRPSQTYYLWNAGNSWTPNKIRTPVETIAVPTWIVKTKNIEDCVKEQIPEYIKADCEYPYANMFIITRFYEDEFSEIGICLYPAKGTKRNMEMEKYIKKMCKLWIFS